MPELGSLSSSGTKTITSLLVHGYNKKVTELGFIAIYTTSKI
jgi:hypothetical protein